MLRLSVRCPAERAEEVLGAMLELAPAGVEERDEGTVVEYAVYGAPGELPELAAGPAVVGGVEVEVTCAPVPDDWAERWKRFHRPILIDGRLYVRPSWEEPAMRGNVTEVVIDPGPAFGTGSHPTTRLCLELMLELKPGGSFCDVGCGSGVLAIAAAKLGWDPVIAVDADRAAVDTAVANARDNGVIVQVERVDLRHKPASAARTVAANLTTGLLEVVAGNWEGTEAPPEQFVASGCLASELERVERAFAGLGLQLSKRAELEEWGACLLERAASDAPPKGSLPKNYRIVYSGVD